VAGVLYLFDPKAGVETLQFHCCLKGDDGGAPNDKEARDVDCAHQLTILGVGRREHVKRAHAGLQSRLGQELDDLGRTARVSDPCLSQDVALFQAEKSAVLLGDVAVANFALAQWAQESRVHEDEAANDAGALTRHDIRGHASHRVPEQNRSVKSEGADDTDDVARVILIPVPMVRRA
jgi:hypothetical protein